LAQKTAKKPKKEELKVQVVYDFAAGETALQSAYALLASFLKETVEKEPESGAKQA
jgi:hypothetical protein